MLFKTTFTLELYFSFGYNKLINANFTVVGDCVRNMNAGVEAGGHCSMYKKKVIRDLSIIFNGSKC